MDLTAFSEDLSGRLLDFAWDEWAQMGISTTPHRTSPWAQDPEALIVFTLQVARADPRLFDELLDWMLLNEALFSVRRLRAVCIDDTDRALVAAAIGWLARRRPRARLRTHGREISPGALEPLFTNAGPTGAPDPDFAAAGWLRPAADPSGKSRSPDLSLAINLDFRLRGVLGVGIRAEVVRILLCVKTPWMTAGALARSAAYAKRNVHEALAGLAAARAISMFTVGGEQRYTIDRAAWGALLGISPGEMPIHREWPQLLGALRAILRWSVQPQLREASEYMRASSTRQLLDRLEPELAFAGVSTNLRATVESAPHALEEVTDTMLGDILPTAATGPPRTSTSSGITS
jgi:hypothetical protein